MYDLNDSNSDILDCSYAEARQSGRTKAKRRVDYLREFENIINGLRIVCLLVFAVPLVLGAFILLIAALFSSTSPITAVFVPNGYWRNVLSITFRIGLIPGVVVLICRIANRRRGSGSRRFLAIFLSLLLIAVFAFAPGQGLQPVRTAANWPRQSSKHLTLKSSAIRIRAATHSLS
jgi:hypothetical protein